MTSIIRELIEYKGIDDCIRCNINNFKQINYESIFLVPCQKPDIEQIIEVDAKADILEYEVIKTPTGVSLEGQQATGYKLIVNGDINYKIQYIARQKSQTVHTFHNKTPFCGYIVLSEKFNKASYVNPYAMVEDIMIDKMDERCVYSNINLLLVVDVES